MTARSLAQSRKDIVDGEILRRFLLHHCMRCELRGTPLEIVQVFDFQDAFTSCDVKRVGEQNTVWVKLIGAITHFIDNQIDPALRQEAV
jgi:hypothetical protein